MLAYISAYVVLIISLAADCASNEQECDECSNLDSFWANICKKVVARFKNAVNEAKKFVCRLSQLDQLMSIALSDNEQNKQGKIAKAMEYAKNNEPQMHQLMQQLIDAFQSLNQVNPNREGPFVDERHYNNVLSLAEESAHFLEHRFDIHLAIQFSSSAPMDFDESKIVPMINWVRKHFVGEKNGHKEEENNENDSERKRHQRNEEDERKRLLEKETNDAGGTDAILHHWANSSANNKSRQHRRKKRDILGVPFFTVVLLWLLTLLLIFIVNTVAPSVASFIRNQITSTSAPISPQSPPRLPSPQLNARNSAARSAERNVGYAIGMGSRPAPSAPPESSSTRQFSPQSPPRLPSPQLNARNSAARSAERNVGYAIGMGSRPAPSAPPESSSTRASSSRSSRRTRLPAAFNELANRTITQSGETCVICLSELQLGEVVKELPLCIHQFHNECIELWLQTRRRRPTCPACRSKILSLP